MRANPRFAGSVGKRGSQSAATSPIGAMQPVKDPDKRGSIIDAVSSLNLTETSAWEDLANLSASTSVNFITAVPEGIFEIGSRNFTTVATVYVDLTYDEPGETYTVSDSFPMIVSGHFSPRKKAVIDSAEVDTSSFYE